VRCGSAPSSLWSASAESTPQATGMRRQKQGVEEPLPKVAAAAAARSEGFITRSGRQFSRQP